MPMIPFERIRAMKDIEIYTTPTCGYCHAAKRLLTTKGASFREINVAGDPALRQEMMTAVRPLTRCRRSSSAANTWAAATIFMRWSARASSTRCSPPDARGARPAHLLRRSGAQPAGHARRSSARRRQRGAAVRADARGDELRLRQPGAAAGRAAPRGGRSDAGGAAGGGGVAGRLAADRVARDQDP